MAAKPCRNWAVPKLKAELRARGAVVTGRKIDLIERLEAYERNHDFKAPAIDVPKHVSVSWPTQGYQQLIADHKVVLPKITSEQIETYILYRIAADNQASADTQAMEKGGDLMAAQRVLACSLLFDKDHIFLSGIVKAAMKSKLSYNYKLRLEKVSGEPVNSECECPAGMGPHSTCKHIAAVLLMLEVFTDSGEIRVEKSCTENLQNFHKPKFQYEGKPVPSADIPTKRYYSDTILDDPRPLKYRNNPGYTSYVHNATINYCSQSSMDMAMRYLIPVADLQTASKDHDYLELPFTQHMVDRAQKVTERQAQDIQSDTKLQAKSQAWIHNRKWRITASKFGDVTHSTSRRNMEKLCSSILSSKPIIKKSVFHGKAYERKAITKFEQKTGLRVKKCGLFIDMDYPYLGATPDGVITEEDKKAIVEVKCPYTGRNESIKPGPHFNFLKYDENGQIVLNVHSKYYDQIQGQMLLSKHKLCYFVVYTFCDLFVQGIEIDRDYCNFSMLPKLDLFYYKHFRPFVSKTL